MQTPHNIYLFMKSFSVNYAIYILGQEARKARAERGVGYRTSQRQHRRSKKKN
jgi:hypothetical protein